MTGDLQEEIAEALTVALAKGPGWIAGTDALMLAGTVLALPRMERLLAVEKRLKELATVYPTLTGPADLVLGSLLADLREIVYREEVRP